MRIYIVYELYIGDEFLPFYVGKSFKGSDRLDSHIREAKKGKTRSSKVARINKALRNNLPIITKIVFVADDEPAAYEKEKELIAFYGRRDTRTGILCNHTDGGDGVYGPRSESHKKAMSLSQKGKPRPYACKRVSAYRDDDLVGTYNSVVEASVQLDVYKQMISAVLNGRRKHTYSRTTKIKYTFKYEND